MLLIEFIMCNVKKIIINYGRKVYSINYVTKEWTKNVFYIIILSQIYAKSL